MGVGLADAIAAPRGRPGVQGIASNLDDLLLRGSAWKAQVGDALVEGKLVRTIGGGSTVELEIHDHDRKLLRHPLLQAKYDVKLDGLGFRYVRMENAGIGEPTLLVHEALAVARLKEGFGPYKVGRDKITRAEFAKRRVRSIPGPPIPFICPELHVVQPIGSSKEAREAKADAKEERGKGVGASEHLTVKGAPADPSQISLGDDALRIAERLQSPASATMALMEALIVESEMGKASSNVLQGTEGKSDGAISDINGFLTGKGWTGTGAIPYAKAHPDAKPYEIAQAVQASGAGEGSNGRANYGAVESEARAWLEAAGGGSVSALQTIRYAFDQGKKESDWKCIKRLAGEVNWRCFESAGAVYYIDEIDLLASMMRAVISDATPGVENTTVRYDVGHPINQVTISARARSWAAPPGTVVKVTRHGPADGLYLVERIDAPLRKRNSLCEITLKRPTKPLPEPRPEQKSVSVGFGGTGTGEAGDLASIQIPTATAGSPFWGGTAAIFKQFVHPFMEDHGLQPGAEKEEGHAEGSDHALYSKTAYATDYPTTDGAKIANELGQAMGRSGSSVGTFERFDITVDGMQFSVQILWAVPDHYDHVHVGIQRL